MLGDERHIIFVNGENKYDETALGKNVLIFRKRMPKAPGTFKIPLNPVIPIIGIIENVFMIWNIDGDPAVRSLIFTIDGIIFVLLAVYAALWCKF